MLNLLTVVKRFKWPPSELKKMSNAELEAWARFIDDGI
jgi:hypothetical protein